MFNLLELWPKLTDQERLAIGRARRFSEGKMECKWSFEDAFLDAQKAFKLLDAEYHHYRYRRTPASENWRATQKVKKFLASKGVEP